MSGEQMNCFISWEPMMKRDNLDSAVLEAGHFDGLGAVHYWDQMKEFGNYISGMLDLKTTAWDIYLFFSRETQWVNDSFPEPAFWMHQLPESAGSKKSNTLNTNKLIDKLLPLLNVDAGVRYPDLGFHLHASALSGIAGRGNLHSVDDLHEIF